MPKQKLIALSLVPIPDIGWGVMSLNLMLQLLRLPDRTIVPLLPFRPDEFAHPLHRRLLETALAAHHELQSAVGKQPNQQFFVEGAVLHAFSKGVVVSEFGLQMSAPWAHIRGQANLGITFQENTRFQPEAIEHARLFDRILAGSTWNARLLQNNGLAQAVPLFQGIDRALFHPDPSRLPLSPNGEGGSGEGSGLLPGRFVIYSGGKLEYRKGQDQIVAAFKVFHARHAEAFLLTAWQSYLPVFMHGLEYTGHVQGLPELDDQRHLHVQSWLERNGIAPRDCFDIGKVPNHVMPQVLREADVAVFCSRCEGGTNMAAMECLACGLPTILSANTGHLDLIGEGDHCYPLRSQGPVKPTEVYAGVDGWGESSVDEIVDALEAVYADRTEAARRGQAAARFMADWTWEKQVQRLLMLVDAPPAV